MVHDTPTRLISVPGTLRHGQAMTTRNSRGGRPSKGDRDAFKVRPARPVGERVRELAEAAGMSYSDYIAAVLARDVGMPDLAPRAENARHEELPIPAA